VQFWLKYLIWFHIVSYSFAYCNLLILSSS
jgi:hypothetical protein